MTEKLLSDKKISKVHLNKEYVELRFLWKLISPHDFQLGILLLTPMFCLSSSVVYFFISEFLGQLHSIWGRTEKCVDWNSLFSRLPSSRFFQSSDLNGGSMVLFARSYFPKSPINVTTLHRPITSNVDEVEESGEISITDYKLIANNKNGTKRLQESQFPLEEMNNNDTQISIFIGRNGLLYLRWECDLWMFDYRFPQRILEQVELSLLPTVSLFWD